MRRFILLLIFALCLCYTSRAEARKYALLVGVDDYTNVPKLKCCVNDMNTLKEALMKIGFDEDNIQVLVTGSNAFSELPTKKNIQNAITYIVKNAKSSDMVFIALSGHGAQDGKNVYFCPPDVEVDDLEGTCVSITKVMNILATKCEAKFKWMVVDACRNDPNQNAKGIGGKGLQVIPTPPEGIALFQSCAKGEESWEDRASGNGYFTKNFAAALSGEADTDHDGKLTLMEVCKWTTAKTKEQVRNSQNKSQRPYFSGSISDFTLAEDLNVNKAQELVAEAQKARKRKEYSLAIDKYNEAIALCPQFESWKEDRDLLEELLRLSSTGENNLPPKPPVVIEQPPTFPNAPAPSIPSGTGYATQRFHKLSNQAKEYYQKFMSLEKEFKSATPARQKQIQNEVQEMAKTIQSFKAPLLAAAKAAFKEAPNEDKDVKAFLLNNIVMMVNYDDYENALKECDELIRLGLVEQPICEIAAFSAFNSNQFAYAEAAINSAKKLATAALDRAKKQGKTQAEINKEGIGQVHPGLEELEKNLPYYKNAWAKEKILRQASSQAKDCPIVELQTTAGDITIELFANEAPNTVANFIELVNKGFYDGLTFHRVMQGFMAQGGDPNGDGTGGPGYFIPCEVDNPNARIHFRGSLSMANAGKDTGGSQFFITFVPTRWLDGKNTVFGRVISGFENLAKITRDPDPKTPGFEPTKIIKAEVTYMTPQLKLSPVKKLPAN